MPKQVQFRRGNKAQNDEFIGAPGEISINQESQTIRVHDGSTAGGFELARANLSNVSGGTTSNIGIGTTVPTSKLHVVGDVRITGVVTATSFVGDGSNLTGIITSTSGSINASNLNVSGIGSFGNIQISSGIITASSGIVTYYGDGSNLIGIKVALSTNTTNSNQYIPYATSFGSAVGLGATSAFVFNPFSGNLGIGTANPSSKLHVIGNANVSGIVTAGSLHVSVGTTVIDSNRNLMNIASFDSTVSSLWDQITTTAISKTLLNREYCTVTAAGQTITLPASPSAGWEVVIGVGNFVDTIIGRNGQNIMGLAEDMTIDVQNATVNLIFIDATRGWRIS